jgi:FtsZ-binding cell division protein ZapB
MEYQFLESKYNNLNDEYTKDKNEFKQTVNNYNDMLIESKLRIKTYEEKIKNFENEKKTLKETNERTIKANNKSSEEKIEKMNMEINKLKSEIKAKEEELLIYKLNDEKVSALNIQKINFLEKELSQWKERYNSQSKELSENKSQMINLNSDLDKLKNENKSLKNKAEIGGMLGKIDENFRGSANNFFTGTSGGSISGSLGAASSRILSDLLIGQNYIKDYIKEIMDKTNELVENNKNIYENNQNISQFLRGFKGLSNNGSSNNSSISNFANINNNSISNKDTLNTYNKKDNLLTNNYNTQPPSKSVLLDENIHAKNQENNQKLVHHVKYNSIDKNKNQSKNMNLNSINNNYNTINTNTNTNTNNNNSNINVNTNNLLDIKVSNSVLKKDITGKPFLDYICDVKNGNESYTLNKKFGHFIMLHKSLKLLFKDLIQLPDGGNLFISITDMKQNTFHENKLTQLDRYINDLLAIDQVKNSEPFKDFFELDEQHEQNNNKIRKNKTMIDNKRFSKYSSSNTLNKDTSDYSNSLINFK